MYNLLVCADERVWESPFYEYEKIRIFEYTPEYLKRELNSFSVTTIKKLASIPSLFVHERFDGKSKIGYIKEIKQNYNKYRITLDFLCEISSKKSSLLQHELDVGNFEINRTHWAVKDIDLLNLLLKKEIISDEQSSLFRKPDSLPRLKFDVAFSFPREERELILKIVKEIKEKGTYSIFYDKDFVEQLAVPVMDLILMDVYKKQSRLICILLSEEYKKKMVSIRMESNKRNYYREKEFNNVLAI